MAQIGSVLDGKYEILKQIGSGGMSTVYLSMDKRLNKQWAVKEIKRLVTNEDNTVMIQRLMREANMMKQLDHPSLPRIVNIIDNGDTFYIVMDYIEGETLNQLLLREGAQPEEMVISWAKTLCDVLQYLHTQSPPIIYRDMKPENIMLKPEGQLKLIDFGIAREFKEQSIEDTSWLGTRGYAAPEQFGGQGQTDARTDVFGLGATLYHLVTGHNPSKHPFEMYPIRQWNPSLSKGFEAIIRKCTQLNPEDRYQNTETLLYDLENYTLVDQSYRRKQKRKLTAFMIIASLSLGFAGLGIGGQVLSDRENNRNYEKKISISTSTDQEAKEASYEEAIALIGNDLRAYIKLLEAYESNSLFGEKEAGTISTLYNQNKDLFEPDSEDFLDLNYKIGSAYFYLYSGSDGSFRTRALKARPYFSVIVQSGNTAYENRSVAESFSIVCEFYSQYVANTAGIKEPAKEDYESLLVSLDDCIEGMQSYEYNDGAYIKLTMYREVANLLNDHRKGFATHRISKERLLELMDKIYTYTQSLNITQETTLDIQSAVLQSVSPYKEAIESTYTNTEIFAETGDGS